MTGHEASLGERVLRIEGALGLRPDLRFAGGSEWWVVQAAGRRGDRALDYWGPFASADDARQANVFKPVFGCVVVEVPL